jgi:hypothetical protein
MKFPRFITRMATRIYRGDRDARRARFLASARQASVVAGSTAGANGRAWTGVRSQYDEDAFNKDYLEALGTVQGRAQDLDVNNPDIGGFNRTRVAQVLGQGVVFKHCPRAAEVGLTPDKLALIEKQVNRARELHSQLGGFDSTGRNRSEGKQQERALLSMFIYGSCLIHRVGRSNGRTRLPFAIELIPGSRISTPIDRYGDPKISYGIEYTDEHRTVVVGYHVRRVSKTIGNNFVTDVKWDLIPAADASYLAITEAAGLDRELPQCVRVIRMTRNRGEFIESAVESARAQARHYAKMKCAKNADPYSIASDDSQPVSQFTDCGGTDGVSVIYTANDEEFELLSGAKLPEPDFPGFMDVTDSRTARGLVSSLSRFTREVTSSWAGGRMEDQQDDPVIAQYRRSFLDAWQIVNEWFTEAVWLAGEIDLPGYSLATRAFWCQYRGTFPGKLHINPTDTMKARETAYMLRADDPFHGAEEDGGDAEERLIAWAKYAQLQEKVEQQFKLKPHTLDILFGTKSITTAAGADLAPPTPDATQAPDQQEQTQAPPNKREKRKQNRAARRKK